MPARFITMTRLQLQVDISAQCLMFRVLPPPLLPPPLVSIEMIFLLAVITSSAPVES